MDIAISFGTYYSYLEKSNKILKNYTLKTIIQTFNDGELAVEFDTSVRGKQVFIFGDTTKNLTELIMTVDAARRSGAGKIIAVLPYFGFARQDKKGKGRACIGASVICRLLESIGVNAIISMDIHAEQIQGMVLIPFDNLNGVHIFGDYIKETFDTDTLLATPDAGGTVRVKKLSEYTDLGFVVMDKTRPKPGQVGKIELFGDVTGKNILLRDDIVDTGGTLIKAVEKLKEKGAKDVFVVITHPVCSNGALDKMKAAGVNMITCNTRNTVVNIEKNYPNVKVMDCMELLTQAIVNMANNGSVTALTN